MAEIPPSDHLPPGFGWAWRYSRTRATLFYGSKPIADIQGSSGNWVVHTSMHRMQHELRHALVTTRELAIRYAEAYARRWEDRIRHDLRQLGERPVPPVGDALDRD